MPLARATRWRKWRRAGTKKQLTEYKAIWRPGEARSIGSGGACCRSSCWRKKEDGAVLIEGVVQRVNLPERGGGKSRGPRGAPYTV
jgi:hypothetical protein